MVPGVTPGVAPGVTPHLLLDAAKQSSVVPLFGHQLLMSAVLSDLSILHQHNVVTLGQILEDFKKKKKERHLLQRSLTYFRANQRIEKNHSGFTCSW